MQDMLKRLVDAPSTSRFTLNRRFECEFADKQLDKQFNTWKKEANSPAIECEVCVRVVDMHDDSRHNGTIVVQKNTDLDGMLSGALFLTEKSDSDSIGYTMLSIVSIAFN